MCVSRPSPSLVSRARTISTNAITGTGEKKCSPNTRLGSRTSLASRAIGIADVFDAMSVCSPTMLVECFHDRGLQVDLLRHGLDHKVGTADVLQFARQGNPGQAPDLDPAASSLPRFTARSNEVSSRWRVASRYSGSSRTMTGIPARRRSFGDACAHESATDDGYRVDWSGHDLNSIVAPKSRSRAGQSVVSPTTTCRGSWLSSLGSAENFEDVGLPG